MHHFNRFYRRSLPTASIHPDPSLISTPDLQRRFQKFLSTALELKEIKDADSLILKAEELSRSKKKLIVDLFVGTTETDKTLGKNILVLAAEILEGIVKKNEFPKLNQQLTSYAEQIKTVELK